MMTEPADYAESAGLVLHREDLDRAVYAPRSNRRPEESMPPASFALACCDAPMPTGDPVDDQAAVFLRRLLPREVAGVEGMDLAVGEAVVEVLVVRPRHEVVVAALRRSVSAC